MPPRITNSQRKAVRVLLAQGLDRETVAAQVGVTPGQVSAVAAHVKMGTYEKHGTHDTVVERVQPEVRERVHGLLAEIGAVSRRAHTAFDHAPSAAHATLRLHQLRKDIHALEAPHRAKVSQCCDAHWEQAWRSLRTKGMGTPRRGSNAASGMRLLRRRETNHAGIRSAATRQHDVQSYQAIQSLSRDMAEFIAQGPHMATLPCV